MNDTLVAAILLGQAGLRDNLCRRCLSAPSDYENTASYQVCKACMLAGLEGSEWRKIERPRAVTRAVALILSWGKGE